MAKKTQTDSGRPKHNTNPKRGEMSLSLPLPPIKPSELQVQVHPDKSLEIRWLAGDADSRYQLELHYFQLEGHVIDPQYRSEIQVEECEVLVPHLEEVPKDQAWVVKIILKAVSQDGSFSDPVKKMISWDDELSSRATLMDLTERVGEFQKKDLNPFVAAKGNPQILVLGPQHHGKSSAVNHFYRCLKCDLSQNDQMCQAPAGVEEKTKATKNLPISFGSSSISFIDTMAFANMNDETAGQLKSLLSTGSKDGMRRNHLGQDEKSWFSKPPSAAILVMSLCHWRDQTDEMQKYVEQMANIFKHAAGGQVEFPYCVALTHRDKFLKECQEAKPCFELKKMVEKIKQAASTDYVYSITNYQHDSPASARNNKATFDLLSQLLTLAKNEKTASVSQEFGDGIKSCFKGAAGASCFAALRRCWSEPRQDKYGSSSYFRQVTHIDTSRVTCFAW